MLLHRILRRLATWAVCSFFREIHIVGEENVPPNGPVIVVCTHHNMMIDPAILSSMFPHKRQLHYWAKSSLFKNPLVANVLRSTGNIPVDRKNKDNQVLFQGTFHVLAAGQVVALFPEGTSYTEPRIMQVKDGASWSALEYTKWAKSNVSDDKPLVVVPAGIVYTDKSKYRSSVIMEFGKPIAMDSYETQFLSSDAAQSRVAVKKLTAQIEYDMVKLTINAPDWETLYVARMARDLLWRDEKAINPDDFVSVSQTLVDLFSTRTLPPTFGSLKRTLLTYYALLHATKLTNATLSTLPLPETLNPLQPTPLPSRLSTLSVLLRDSLSSLVRLPFFLLPLIVHLPAYAMSRLGARLAEDEEETQAQNKVVFALLLLLAIYPSMFFFLWALFWLTPVGAVIALAMSYAFVVYHVKIVDDNYEHAKRVSAAWRVLVGVWTPKRWDLSIAALAPYITPPTPPPNEWLAQPKMEGEAASKPPTPTSELSPARKKRRLPSRRLIRHVLRARADSARLLAAFFGELERSGKVVRASTHLARLYGASESAPPSPSLENTADGVQISAEPHGWRDPREVIRFLRQRGAKIGDLGHRVEGDWAAASSDGEGEPGEIEVDTEDDMVWVPSGQTSL